MGIDFDILEHCKKVRADHGPPYICPIKNCKRTYKSVCGLQYHLKSYDHDNPTPSPTIGAATAATTSTSSTTPTAKATPKGHKKGGNRHVRTNSTTTKTNTKAVQNVIEPLTYEEAQKLVQFEINGRAVRWNINDTLDIVSREELADEDIPIIKENQVAEQPTAKLPEANFKELEDYNICDAPPRPNAYIRFIEKSVEELDGEVEYDVDEEDTTWLAIMNERREASGLNPVSVDSLELLMDRLEKESYFQASVNGHTGAVVDDDAVCCICMDGECQNTNVILFCDMCNLAVHQDCYGVPYIPEGQWLCRRCLQSPSRAVDCVLCPNQGGAFKQTDQGQWAHVVCALWIPEVRFANTVFLEPIDSIETIPAARWKLSCYICKQRSVGACIQCHKTNCYQAFHVTCAQQAGLYMKMDTVKDSGGESQPVLVQKIAYCDVHAPPDSDSKKEDARIKMKNARKLLAKKRTTAPIILIPTIPPERIQEIGSLVTIAKKSQFIQRLIAYWTLKRQFRNGVPLLRRLQSSIPPTNNKLRDNINSLINNTTSNNNNNNNNSNSNNNLSNNNNNNRNNTNNSLYSNIDTIELYNQLKYWQCLRQDLERARLLCELVRKREKIKLEQIKITEKCLNIQLKPLEASLRLVLDLIQAKDTNEIFTEPVDLEEVPDYTTVVTEPMDLSTMRKKLESGQYPDLTTMEKDFDLMIQNCLAYNNRDTVFYRAGIKMRDQCALIFRHARKELENCGLLNETNPQLLQQQQQQQSQQQQKNDDMISGDDSSLIDTEEFLASDIDKELENLQDKTGPDVIQKLEDLLIKCQALKYSLVRTKRVKLVRTQLTRLKKILNTDSSQSDDNYSLNDLKNSTQQSLQSPSGVNRRTAVLFTRKAQAALKDNQKAPTPTATTTTTSNNNNNSNNTANSSNNNNNSNKDDVPKEQSPSVSTNSSTIKTTATTSTTTKSTNKRSKRSNKRDLINNPINQQKLEQVPDSFKVYRANTGDHITDDEHSDSDTSLSTCYSHDISEIDSDDDDDDDDQDEDDGNTNDTDNDDDNDSKDNDEDDEESSQYEDVEKIEKVVMKPLQLVWAKCRGYPWYPALIIDPKMPKGYVHKGVPIPSPPQEVLALSANYSEHVYLVLFFDAKRTWQWLPAEKLEIMGIDQERDEAKVNESRKATDRKAVRKAYEHALSYISQINSNPDDDEEEEEEEEDGDVVS